MRIGLLITARMKSSRLPFKLLKDLNGHSIIEHVVNRSKKIKGVDEIVMCTSTNPQDRPLVDVAVENQIYYFLGSEEDVLDRLYNASKFYGFDYVLSITGENPIYSIDYANRLVDLIKREQPDFTTIEGLPIGSAVYGLSVKALELVCEVKKEVDTEIWGILFNQPEIFKIKMLQAEDFFTRPELRLTNDYPEDFRLMSKIFQAFPHQTMPSLLDVLELLDDNPHLLDISKDRKQAALDPAVINRINTFYEENQERILAIKKEIYAS